VSLDNPTIASWRSHYLDEADAAFLYAALADIETDPDRSALYRRLADVEDRHVGVWASLFRENGLEPPEPKPTFKARIRLSLAKRFGSSFLLNVLLKEEGEEVRGYLNLHRDSTDAGSRAAALLLAKESAEHALSLRKLSSRKGEPWHQLESGDLLRNVVYGFNDGLTANFGLVAGVLGANVDAHIVILSGLAGTIADALSMGASGYLAAKSEQEVHDHEIAMERKEIRLMPELEREELALIYQAKGMDREAAESLARTLMENPDRALKEMIREELRIGEQHSTPMREAWITGIATAFGAFIPVAPFMIFSNLVVAAWVSFAIAMLSHFAVGAARSLFTGRGLMRSGFDMFAVGLGVAIVGYFFGYLITGVMP